MPYSILDGALHFQRNCPKLPFQSFTHQFFTIVDDAVQERDLVLYLDITPPFSNWISYCRQTECPTTPHIVINGYLSFETNFEWRHFDGTRLLVIDLLTLGRYHQILQCVLKVKFTQKAAS